MINRAVPASPSAVDVLVIGAGPAGSVAAAMVHKTGLSVAVVEREQFPRFVIGESLLPRCMEVLQDAGLLDCIKAKGFQEKFGAKFIKGDAVSDFNFSEQFTDGWKWTWQVPRAEFDLALIEEVARRGVPVAFRTTVQAIDFHADESSTTTIERPDGSIATINAKFIIDASGYGRVIPRLRGLDRPSTLEPRKAVFAHMQDPKRLAFDEPNRIVILCMAPGVWVWVIPFSNGITSVGIVGAIEYFDQFGESVTEQFRGLLGAHPYLAGRFADQPHVWEPKSLQAWSATTDTFFGPGFVLTGNVTEFLDPIFSSGVMFATVSSHLASGLVIDKLAGKAVDWQQQYTKVVQQGVDTFRTYVNRWYDGTLETLFFAKEPNLDIQRKICSVLAGYVWDTSNPFVANHDAEVARVARIVKILERGAGRDAANSVAG
ncbi:MAG: tryptophan 7-halogenase [Myxococcales bacterium]|nr:tryptophan 7-halogenase [Myxococcales bacterium]